MKFIDVLKATEDLEAVVLVCGGRAYGKGVNSLVERKRLNKVLSTVLHMCTSEDKLLRLVHGGAEGADILAAKWADINNVPATEYKADWTAHGKSAGPIRNLQMLRESNPHFGIAFPGGKGTSHMKDLLVKHSVPHYNVMF